MDRGDAERTDDVAAPGGAAFRGATTRARLTPVAMAVAIVALVAVALGAKLLAPESTATPRPTPGAESASEADDATPAPAPIMALPTRNARAQPFPTFQVTPIEPGRVPLVPAGRSAVRLRATIPFGWGKASDAMYVKRDGAGPAGASISAWRIEHVFAFPCRWSGRDAADPPLMRTARGQAEALSSWWGQDPDMLPYWNSRLAPLATKPDATTFLGQPAWQVDVLVRSDLDPSECDAGQLVLWDTTDGSVRVSLGPGERHRLWVIDLAGELVVIDAASSGLTSSGDLAELDAVVDSMAIDP